MSTTIRCVKMQALGNDFVLVNLFEDFSVTDDKLGSLAAFLCSRHYGMGGDGLILCCPSGKADLKMRIFNPDGTEAEMCGNALRSVARFAYENGVVSKTSLIIETLGGLKQVFIELSGGVISSLTAQVGLPDLRPTHIPVTVPGERCLDYPVTIEGRTFYMSAMSMGNPHCVSFIDDVDTINLEIYGKLMSLHPLFPEKVNTEFTQVLDGSHMKMRSYERGVGETLACGTGCCVSVVAGYYTGRSGKTAEITQRGGIITVEFNPDEGLLFMTGPTESVYTADVYWRS